ncbi:MAG: prepilin peptidase [Elusimicrobia bacterium]|nr:prepilin peptidase [Elusimicrobiota bacterium]
MAVAVALLGAVMGSFLNVVIHRLPIGELPWKPPHSYCPGCRRRIPAMDNIPLISFFLLGGRCRSCRAPISWRYPIVEFVMMLVALATLWRFGLTQDPRSWISFAMFFVFAGTLLAIAAIDFETYLIPDALSLGLMVFMAILAPFNPLLRTPSWTGAYLASLLGILAGSALYWLFAAIGKKIYKEEAMGGGDIKLAGAIGACLGPGHLFGVIVLSSALGLLYALPLLLSGRLKRRDPIPYGPFLSAAAIIILWWSRYLPDFLRLPFLVR